MAQNNRVVIDIDGNDNVSAVLRKVASEFTKFEKKTITSSRAAANATIDQKASIEGIVPSTKAASDGIGKLDKKTKSLTTTMVKSGLQMFGLVSILRAIGRIFQTAIADATQYQMKMTELSMISQKFGLSQKDTTVALQQLTSDGLLSTADAAETLSSIIVAGQTDMGQAVQLINAYKDAAALGGDTTLSFSEKVRGLAESYLTEMSIMGNARGLQENWNQIIAEGERITGLSIETATKAQRNHIKTAGTLSILQRATGGADAYAKSHLGTLARLRVVAKEISTVLGNVLLPSIAALGEMFMKGSTGADVLIFALKSLGMGLFTIVTLARAAASALGAVFSVAGVAITKGLKAAKWEWNSYVKEMRLFWAESAVTGAKIMEGSFFTPLDIAIDKALQDMQDTSASAGKMTQKMAEETAKAVATYMRAEEKRVKDFKRSLADLVWAHQDKKRALEEDLRDETDSYKKANEERLKDFIKAMADLEKAHKRKVRDGNEDVEDENDRHARSVEKIQQDIRDEEQKGIMINGVFNSQADQKKLAELRARLSDEMDAHEEKLKDIQQKIADELEDYTDALDEKKAMFEEETTKATEEHNKRVAETQKELDTETALLEKHSDLVASIKDQQKTDDIERLVQQHEEEKAESLRSHLEKLEEIKKQGAAEGAGYGGAYGGALGKAIDEKVNEMKENQQKTLDEIEKYAGESGEKAGKGWIQRAIEGLMKWSTVYQVNEFVKSKTEHQAHGGIVGGPVDAPVPTILHGGERVIPRSGVDVNGGGSGLSINFNGTVNMQSKQDADYLAEKVITLLGRRNELAGLGSSY